MKVYEDIQWETIIRKNELNNLYVSQLDLYLIKNLNLSKKQCSRKGYTKAAKIEEVKQHFSPVKQ